MSDEIATWIKENRRENMGEDTFKIDGDDHRIGDDGCQECWCGYPHIRE